MKYQNLGVVGTPVYDIFNPENLTYDIVSVIQINIKIKSMLNGLQTSLYIHPPYGIEIKKK